MNNTNELNEPSIQRKSDGLYINNVRINPIELSEKNVYLTYEPIEREEQINNLYDWICGADETDAEMMKNDIQYLYSLTDQWILSSTLTNEYLAFSSDGDIFATECDNIVKIQLKRRYS